MEFELLAGLAAEANDHVGRDRDPGHGGADRSESLEVMLDRVLAAHPAQHGVVARLDRQVQVLAHGPAVREGRDETVRQVPRVGGNEAQPRYCLPAIGAAQPVDRANELGEVWPAVEVELATGPTLGVDVGEARLGRQVVTVAVHVLTEERDLPEAGGGQGPRLVDDLVERPAALGTATERNDAVGARLVAAVDDRQPCADRRTARDRALGDGSCPGSRQVVGDAHHRPAYHRRRANRADRRLGGRQSQPVHELGLLVRAQEQVDRRVAAVQPVAMRLADRAPGEDHAETGVRLLEACQLPLAADDLLLRALADRTGVDDDQVGRLHRRGLGAARREQPAGHLLGVAPVHLAAERPHVERREGALVGAVLREPLVGDFGGGARRGRLGRKQVENR